jgi:hypothetical protein
MNWWLVLGVTATLAGAGPSVAQTAGKWTPTRNAWGQPDLEGAWTNATLTSPGRPARYGARLVMTPDEVAQLERAALSQIDSGNQPTDPNAPPLKEGAVGGYNRGFLDPGTQVMRVRGEPRTSLFTTPDGLPPKPRPGVTLPAGEIMVSTITSFFKLDANGSVVGIDEGEGGKERYDNPEELSLGERCLTSFGRNTPPPMFGNGFYNNNYQFMQSRDAVLIIVEMVHDQRLIRLNTKTHLPASVRPWFGDSIGWYDGDTLVVETTNFPKIQAYFGAWEHLKVTERFTRVAKDRLHYRFMIEDPTVWEKPWGGEYEFAALDGRLYEYACHEGNYAMPGILGGTRRADALAKRGE